MKVSTIGLDLAKNVFTVHGVDEGGSVVVRRSLRRAQVLPFFAKLERCLIGIEACGGAHDWARRLIAMGHDVRLMPASYVKPYIKRGKTDANDAAAICEAVTRPTMHFVPIKTQEQQGLISLHRARRMLVTQKVMLENAIRALCAEFGIVAMKGRNGIVALQRLSLAPGLPATALRALRTQFELYELLTAEAAALKREIIAVTREDETSLGRRLETIPGVGPMIASAAPAIVGDPARFGSGRQFAAWLGLTPRLSGTGGKTKLGPVSKCGDRYLRSLFVEGACSVLMAARKPGSKTPEWVRRLAARKDYKVAAVALANKNARIVWALMTKGGRYDAAKLQPAIERAA
jgi:transposase